LRLDVFLVVEQHAARILQITSGPPGFLQVVFQRAGDVGMDDEAHIGLSTPMPKALVATMTFQLAAMNACWMSFFKPASSPA
jgi:hypothetical protein